MDSVISPLQKSDNRFMSMRRKQSVVVICFAGETNYWRIGDLHGSDLSASLVGVSQGVEHGIRKERSGRV